METQQQGSIWLFKAPTRQITLELLEGCGTRLICGDIKLADKSGVAGAGGMVMTPR